jgi:hypothetical protein
MADYNMNNLLESTYKDSDEETIYLKGCTMISMSQYVYCSKETYETGKFIKCDDSYPVSCRIFQNNNEVNPLENSYNFKFKKGKNKVVVLIFVPAASTVDTQINHRITHNLNFKNSSFSIFAEPPLSYISEEALALKKELTSLKYYSIDKDNNIILKDKDNKLNQIKYLAAYEYGDNLDFSSSKKLRIMGVLSSLSEDVSPKIDNISLIIE